MRRAGERTCTGHAAPVPPQEKMPRPLPGQLPLVGGPADAQEDQDAANAALADLGELAEGMPGGGMLARLLPGSPSSDALPRGVPAPAEEQRRLAHVAATRARKRHFISYPRYVWDKEAQAEVPVLRSSFLDAVLRQQLEPGTVVEERAGGGGGIGGG